MFLCVCWMSPKISSAMLGGVASMSGGDLTGVGMGVGLAAVGAGVVATQYATRGSDALSKVREAVAAGARGSCGGGSNGSNGAPPRPGGSGGEADQASRVGVDLRPRHKTECQEEQINPRLRCVLPPPKGRASNLVRRDPRRLVRMIPSSVRSNVRQLARTMR